MAWCNRVHLRASEEITAPRQTHVVWMETETARAEKLWKQTTHATPAERQPRTATRRRPPGGPVHKAWQTEACTGWCGVHSLFWSVQHTLLRPICNILSAHVTGDYWYLACCLRFVLAGSQTPRLGCPIASGERAEVNSRRKGFIRSKASLDRVSTASR